MLSQIYTQSSYLYWNHFSALKFPWELSILSGVLILRALKLANAISGAAMDWKMNKNLIKIVSKLRKS